MDRKADILDALDGYYRAELNVRTATSQFKARSYKKVVDAIKLLPHVHSYDDLKDVKGIGEAIKLKIKQVFETEPPKNTRALLESLEKIYGVGPENAKKLVERGVTSLEDLSEKQDLLTANQRLGLKYYADINSRILRSEIVQHIQDVKDTIEGDLTVEVAGSYRRGAADSGDIDFLVTGDPSEFKQLLDKLHDDGYIFAFLSRGSKKSLTLAHIPGKPMRRVDFQFTTPEEFPYALLYFTGSLQFNIRMRNFALSKGYSLSEKGLKPVKPVPPPPTVKTEKDIFDFLGYPFKEPSERTFGGGRLLLKTVKRSHKAEKKWDAVFDRDGTQKVVPFGQKGYSDYTKHRDKTRKQRYLDRHSGMGEHWNKPDTPGALSRWILWNKPSFNASLSDFKKRFGL